MRLQRRPITSQIKRSGSFFVCPFKLTRPCIKLNNLAKQLQSLNCCNAHNLLYYDCQKAVQLLLKTRLDKLSTVVVKVASFVGNPVVSCENTLCIHQRRNPNDAK